MTMSTATSTEPQPQREGPGSTKERDEDAPLLLPQTAPLPASQLAIIKATVPVLQEHGEAITQHMYDTLLTDHPALRSLFSASSQATGQQPRALARAVLAYATHLDGNLPKLSRAIERIAQKHVSLFVRPDQYAVVGVYLIGAIREVLGTEVATAAVVEAWTAAYGVLAGVFVRREGELYRGDRERGWREGWREMRIVRRVVEAEGIVSFWLAPPVVGGERDDHGGGSLPGFLPGQYVSVQVDVPALGHKQIRQFSLSSAPGAVDADGRSYYRVSVKRERAAIAGQADGVVTNLLHDAYHEGDTVGVSPPHGEFFLDPSDDSQEGHPLVLISAGVGATPLVSMLQAVSSLSPSSSSTTTTTGATSVVRRPVSWIHTSRSRAALPFHNEVVSAVNALRERGLPVGMHVHVREEAGSRLDLATLEKGGEKEELLFLQDAQAEYFVCGPEAFMLEVRRKLGEFGVTRERVHLELFATGDVEDD